MSLLETFLFGLCLGALCAVFFFMGWKIGIQNYLKRARAHVAKYGDKYLIENTGYTLVLSKQ